VIPEVSVSFPWQVLAGVSAARRRNLLRQVRESGLHGVTVGDHISFQGGAGFDGLVSAASLLASDDEIPVLVAVYLLALRHPMAVARQVATLSELSPGRLTLGVGVGGDDRAEVANAGVDPSTRGRRTDESLELVRRLLDGEEVTHHGEFFMLDSARVLPAPSPGVPVVVGGKGRAAVRRTAALGDGWIGIFCSARRFGETRSSILEESARIGREAPPTWFGASVWCGIDRDPAVAEASLGGEMESLYKLPYDKFRHIAPAGNPEHVAGWLAPFVAAGAAHLTLVPAGPSPEASVDAVAEVARILRA
jgi:alkanesulfonate monooxygenase SsuD/methylene tetrahydromethanopterin reductase-like flavin-dependent oxidoreductase (luciferase family)